MKGIFEMTESFLKILATAYLAVMLLGIFFSINNYYIYFTQSEDSRNVLTLGDGMLSADCLVETRNDYPIKAMLSEEKLRKEVALSPGSCVAFGRAFGYTIISIDGTKLYSLGDTTIGKDSISSVFPASVKKSTGEVVPVMLNLTVAK